MINKPKSEPIFTFKRLTQEDLPLLYIWFKKPHVAKWWLTPEKDEDFFTKFLERIRSVSTFPFLVLMSNKPIGYIQYYRINTPREIAESWIPENQETTVGTDQFIGEEDSIGKGYGTLFIKEFMTYLTTTLDPTITTIIVDPSVDNFAAIRCYEKVGFMHLGTYKTWWGQTVLMKYEI